MAGEELEIVLYGESQFLDGLLRVLDVALALCAAPHVEAVGGKALAGLQDEHTAQNQWRVVQYSKLSDRKETPQVGPIATELKLHIQRPAAARMF